MRGTVHQREENWVVSCKSVNGEIIEYPIHPDDIWKLHENNVEVEFVLDYMHLETDPPELVTHASITNFIEPKKYKFMDRKNLVYAYNILSIATITVMFFQIINLDKKLDDAELKITALNSTLEAANNQKMANDSIINELYYMRDEYIKYGLAVKLFQTNNPQAAEQFLNILSDTTYKNIDTTNKSNEQLHN